MARLAVACHGCLRADSRQEWEHSPIRLLVSSSPSQARDTGGGAFTCLASMWGREMEDLAQQAPQEGRAYTMCNAAKHELACLCSQKLRQPDTSQRSELARVSTGEVICRSHHRSRLAKLSLYRKSWGPPPHPPGPRLRASQKEDETYFTHLFFIDYFFRAAKMRGRYRDLMDPWSPHRPSLPPTRQHDQRDPPVTVDDTSVSRKSRGLLGVILGGARSVGFHRCRMTCIRHYSIIHGKFAALKILSVLPVHCTPNPNPGNH